MTSTYPLNTLSSKLAQLVRVGYLDVLSYGDLRVELGIAESLIDFRPDESVHGPKAYIASATRLKHLQTLFIPSEGTCKEPRLIEECFIEIDELISSLGGLCFILHCEDLASW